MYAMPRFSGCWIWFRARGDLSLKDPEQFHDHEAGRAYDLGLSRLRGSGLVPPALKI